MPLDGLEPTMPNGHGFTDRWATSYPTEAKITS